MIVVVGMMAGCGGDGDALPPPPEPTPRPTARTPPPPPTLCEARRGRVVARIADPALDELSGLTRAGGTLWAIEDSGAAPVLVALRPDGTSAGLASVTGTDAVDWEDVAAAGDELFVGDIGDNDEHRPTVQIYRVPVPAPGSPATATATRLDLQYPDGPHDAEALIADPVRRELLIITKELFETRAYVTGFDGGALRRGPRVVATVATGASLSADGRIAVVRNYNTLSVWRRRGAERLTKTLARRPCVAPADLSREGQGEAVALSKRGRTALTVPEGAGAALRRYAAP